MKTTMFTSGGSPSTTMDDESASETDDEFNGSISPGARKTSLASARNDSYADTADGRMAENSFRGLGRRLEAYAVLAQELPPDSAELRKRLTDIEKCRDMFTAECGQRREKHDPESSSRHSSPARVPSQESGLMFCRICRETEENREAFVTPCRCRGSVARVHVSCLERWLAESDTSCCELCGHQYVTIRTPKYNVLSSIPAWLANSSNTDMMFDLAAFCVFTPVAFFGTWLGVNAGDNAYLQMSLMAAIDLVYSAWLAMRLQYHAARWYSWWRRKSVVKVILENDNQSSLVSDRTGLKEPYNDT